MSTDHEALLAEYNETKQKLDTLVKEKGRALLSAFFRGLFEIDPSISRVHWTQYTPHFNDGDACEFSVYDREYTVGSAVVETHYTPSGVSQALAKRIRAFDARFEALGDDLFESVFGNDVTVTVTLDAQGAPVFTVASYDDHD